MHAATLPGEHDMHACSLQLQGGDQGHAAACRRSAAAPIRQTRLPLHIPAAVAVAGLQEAAQRRGEHRLNLAG